MVIFHIFILLDNLTLQYKCIRLLSALDCGFITHLSFHDTLHDRYSDCHTPRVRAAGRQSSNGPDLPQPRFADVGMKGKTPDGSNVSLPPFSYQNQVCEELHAAIALASLNFIIKELVTVAPKREISLRF